MAILDSKGRLFGKINILDLGAMLVILLVIFGIFFFPGSSGSIAQVGTTKPVEVDLVVRGLNVREPQRLIEQGLKKDGKTNIIIRNQPHGQINIQSVQLIPRTVLVPQPDGSIKELPEPRKNNYSTDMLMTLEGQAKTTNNGLVLGPSKLRIGETVELDGFNYNFKATIIDIRMKDKA
ncbi:DUF4330 domain-containing protein [Aetokthonos hydrillicola Thurmond2011]|jgi:hypothetical protein|uniref:DUF4330 domain-containing protein n=1 Tax=Aetokthonos hydrillicola Thurmond2011 TaxID=2712845 RepID=A0AAP5IE36_9CYAN|nr:DUF4330 domain-containing protein [Aetokthonos hydrillicola]MBO3462505.1 DUF4330 domain-containing protein [Aetokthonos hydrillicola CCALA 1050]MBW4587476.1 DUF4330 domain-containing protein [Aetokthonos hydrillicola CCALA 1050]MDR9898659.1 DUF4330 domain-containing protein [Aetokthonos hydrillicola Thurmond2011]